MLNYRGTSKLSMNTNTIQLVLAQLAILAFAGMVMISHSQFVFSVALLLGFMLSYSIGSSLALADKIRQTQEMEILQQHKASLGTHIGGAICYIVMLNFMLDKIV